MQSVLPYGSRQCPHCQRAPVTRPVLGKDGACPCACASRLHRDHTPSTWYVNVLQAVHMACKTLYSVFFYLYYVGPVCKQRFDNVLKLSRFRQYFLGTYSETRGIPNRQVLIIICFVVTDTSGYSFLRTENTKICEMFNFYID